MLCGRYGAGGLSRDEEISFRWVKLGATCVMISLACAEFWSLSSHITIRIFKNIIPHCCRM
jgi:dolichyl-phosphate-mannose--protein O-mannosyl transferase